MDLFDMFFFLLSWACGMADWLFILGMNVFYILGRFDVRLKAQVYGLFLLLAVTLFRGEEFVDLAFLTNLHIDFSYNICFLEFLIFIAL